MKLSRCFTVILFCLIFPRAVTTVPAASPLDKLGLVGKSTNLTAALPASVAALAQDQVVSGLKEALSKGVQQAVSSLGREGGFLTNLNVKIPMPEKLQAVDKTLRKLKQDKLADEFVTTMNRAAEQAVPVAAGVFGDAIKQMSVEDAKRILAGTNNAATMYFRRVTETNLVAKFHPIVKAATEKAGVTAAYKQMMDKVNTVGTFGGFGVGTFLNKDAMDIDSYVTGRALDGLFKLVADEEKRIRENPVARTTDLLKQVFGSVAK